MASWRERFRKTDTSVDRLGYWWAVFGPSGVLSVLMSAAATGFAPIVQFGWGAVVFAGVAAACVVMLCASALLLAWRYYHPLPAANAPGPASSRQPSPVPAAATAPPDLFDLNRDTLLLLDFAVDQTTVAFLDDLAASAPSGAAIEGPLELGGDFFLQHEAAQKFLERVQRKLAHTRRAAEIRSVMVQA